MYRFIRRENVKHHRELLGAKCRRRNGLKILTTGLKSVGVSSRLMRALFQRPLLARARRTSWVKIVRWGIACSVAFSVVGMGPIDSALLFQNLSSERLLSKGLMVTTGEMMRIGLRFLRAPRTV